MKVTKSLQLESEEQLLDFCKEVHLPERLKASKLKCSENKGKTKKSLPFEEVNTLLCYDANEKKH